MADDVCKTAQSVQESEGIVSLLDEAMEGFTIVDKRTVRDGYGGVTNQWVDGAKIDGAVTYDSSSEMKVAKAMGSTSAYTLTVRKNVDLDYHMVLRRDSDGKIFRVLANSDEKKTPESAYLNMLQYPVEEWNLD